MKISFPFRFSVGCCSIWICVLTFGLDLFVMGIAVEPICMFEWFVTNGPLVRLAVFGDVTKFTAAPVVASPASVTSTLVLSTCNRFRNVTNSLLRLFKRCCKWTASFVDEASARVNGKKTFYYMWYKDDILNSLCTIENVEDLVGKFRNKMRLNVKHKPMRWIWYGA